MRKGSAAPYDYRKYLDEQLDKRIPSREAASVRRTKVALPRSKEYGTGNVELTLPYLTLPKCRLLCEVDYESMPSFPIFRCSL